MAIAVTMDAAGAAPRHRVVGQIDPISGH